ncbi:MAG TPA: TIGR04282 family arsenosugar biosynthesis glycosyltransferase [Burkholderiales bacterium]|nr:TIGR04282 family arsenosugar biosynthesis glycosyltransferase [Burkholderiales bacterium]
MTTPIIVFAKAPRPGAVKTRLIPALGAAGAARLHERLVERTLATAAAAGVGPLELCVDPASDPFLAARAAAYGATLTGQGPGDLGARMHRAFERALAGASAAILVGADCPALTLEYLREARDGLASGYDVVIGPAADGGYVLIGLRHVDSSLFERIRWGGPEVLEDTRTRFGALGWRWRELDTLWDIDRPEDLERLRNGILDGDRLLQGLSDIVPKRR